GSGSSTSRPGSSPPAGALRGDDPLRGDRSVSGADAGRARDDPLARRTRPDGPPEPRRRRSRALVVDPREHRVSPRPPPDLPARRGAPRLADARPGAGPLRRDPSVSGEDRGREGDDPLPRRIRADRAHDPRSRRARALVVEPRALRVSARPPPDLPARRPVMR